MDIFEKKEIVKSYVQKYFLENAEYFISNKDVVNWEMDHIVETGTQIMCNKWNIGNMGGGFVDAVINNDLSRAVSNADITNQYALRFYCAMLYNMGLPSELV